MSTLSRQQLLSQLIFIHLPIDQGYRPFDNYIFDSVSIAILNLNGVYTAAIHANSKMLGYSFNKEADEEILIEKFLKSEEEDMSSVIRKMNSPFTESSINRAIVNHLVATSIIAGFHTDVPKRSSTSAKKFKHSLENVDEAVLLEKFKSILSEQTRSTNFVEPSDIVVKFYHIRQYANNLFTGMYGTRDYIRSVAQEHNEDNINILSNGGFTVGIASLGDTGIKFIVTSQCLKSDLYNPKLGRKTALKSIEYKPNTVFALDTSKYQGDSLVDDLITHALSINYQHTFNQYIPKTTEQKVLS